MRRLSLARAMAVPVILGMLGAPIAQAKAAVNAQSNATPHVPADAALNNVVVRALHQRFPQTRVGKVNCQIVAGLCEVQAGANIFYVDRRARYLVIGRVYDLEKRLDLTAASQMALGPQALMANSAVRGEGGQQDAAYGAKAERNTGLAPGRSAAVDKTEDNPAYKAEEKAAEKVSLSGLPANGAIVWGGSGETVTVFSDFHCSYCRLLHGALKDLGVRVEERPISILGTRSLSEAVICSPDRAGAVERAYAGEAVSAKPCDTSGLDANEAFAARHGFSGTPVLVRSDGAVLRGYRPRDVLAAWFKASRP